MNDALRKAQEAVDGLNRLKLLVAHRLDTETVREISTLANAGIAAVRALGDKCGGCNGTGKVPENDGFGKRDCCVCGGDGLAHDPPATQPREQAGAGAVAWQYRVLRDDRCWMQWADWPHDERPEQIGRWKAQYRPLYTHPATPSVSLTEADRVGREMLRYLGDDQPNSDISDKANSHLTVGELRAWANRLTAAPAPTEGGDFVPAKRRAVGPCEADYDPLAFEYARGWNDCVDSIKYNRAKPATPSAADYSDEHFLADCLQMTGYLDAEKATEVAGKLLAFVVDMKRDLATPPMVEAGRGVDDAMSRAWRNRFISERTSHYQREGKSYEEAVAYAEADANEYEAALTAAAPKVEDIEYPPMPPLPTYEQPQTYATDRIVLDAPQAEAGELAVFDPITVDRQWLMNADIALGMSSYEGESWSEYESPRWEIRSALGLPCEKRLAQPATQGEDDVRKVAMALAVAMTPHVEPRKVWKGLGSNERKHYDSLAQAALAALAPQRSERGE